MKKIIPALVGLLGLMSAYNMQAQTFSVPQDTVYVPSFSNTATPTDNITNLTGGNLQIRWNVVACDFPTDWLTPVAFGICDAQLCRDNTGNVLWNASTMSGGSFTATYYGNTAHDSTSLFDLTLNLMSATSVGTHYVTVNLMDLGAGHYTKTITFVINKIPTAVPTLPASTSDVVLYPNPAVNELNVVYDAAADVKNIAVYNIIGKVMTVYKVSGSSANLNLENVPAGIYFVRLYNNEGHVVATKKFTKQ